jgi:hypothetical protein
MYMPMAITMTTLRKPNKRLIDPSAEAIFNGHHAPRK